MAPVRVLPSLDYATRHLLYRQIRMALFCVGSFATNLPFHNPHWVND